MGWISRWIPEKWRFRSNRPIQEERPKPYGSNQHLNAPTPPSRVSIPVPPGPFTDGIGPSHAQLPLRPVYEKDGKYTGMST